MVSNIWYGNDIKLMEESLDMFGIKDAFKFFGVDKKAWQEKYSISKSNKPIYISPGVYIYPPKSN